MKRRIVITGIGIVTAFGSGEEINRTGILAGSPAIREISSFDAKKYRGKCGGEAKHFASAALSIIDGSRLDRASHLLIHSAQEALSGAGLRDAISDQPVLLSLGTTLGGMLSGERFHKEVLESGLETARISLLSDYLAQSQAIHFFREFRLRGDFRIFSDACASGTNAIGHAFRMLRAGDFDIAICGGYDAMSEFTFAGFNSLMAVSPGLCRPFDKERDGLVLGEGAGILVLEELGHAIRRKADIIGEVKGYGASSDAYHITSPDPTGKGAAAAIRKALEDAGHPAIDYINAHGTGTQLNDVMESKAIGTVFGEIASRIPVSSIKPMIGHLLGAAGAVEVIASLFAIKTKTLPPNINYTTPDPECALNIVTKPNIKAEVSTVLSSSFGFGGSNAAMIIGEYHE